MRKKNLLMLSIVISLVVYGQQGYKAPSKVYLKTGVIKEGKAEINTSNSRVAGIAIKSKKFQKEIILKPKSGKNEKISISEIDKIDFSIPAKLLSKETKIVTYRPLNIEGDEILARELVKGKLYSISKILGFSNSISGDGTKEIYYIKKDSSYKKTTISEIKKEYGCSMEGKGNKEEKIVRCLKT